MLGQGSVRFPTSPTITTINAIKTFWLCEEEPREEAPLKEEEEIRLEFLEIF